MPAMRIVSLLPSATEIVADLGLLGSLVGRSHACNWPESVRSVPAVSSSRIDSAALDGRQIDEAVRDAVVEGEALYAVDGELLAALRPYVILTQDLCRVCAVSGGDIADVGARVISLGPRTLHGVVESVGYLGRELGVPDRGEEVAREMIRRIEGVRRIVAGKKRPRVFVAEWIDPPFACGHWIPEMVVAAGGQEILGRRGTLDAHDMGGSARGAAGFGRGGAVRIRRGALGQRSRDDRCRLSGGGGGCRPVFRATGPVAGARGGDSRGHFPWC